MQASLFLTMTNNQSQNYLINFNCLTNQNSFKLIMRGWFHSNKMHANSANLIMWYLSIWRSNLEIEHTIMIVNLKIIFMMWNEWINACNAIMNFGYMNGHSSHLPWLNYGCKIECLQWCWKIYLFTCSSSIGGLAYVGCYENTRNTIKTERKLGKYERLGWLRWKILRELKMWKKCNFKWG